LNFFQSRVSVSIPAICNISFAFFYHFGIPDTLKSEYFLICIFSAKVARGDVLVIAGAEGQAVQLLRAENAAELSGQRETNDISFLESKIYVGDLPDLSALGGLNGDSSPPVAVLGIHLGSKAVNAILCG